MADTNLTPREIIIFADKDSLSQDAAHRFVSLAAQRNQAGQTFTVALAGGSTPALLYSLLAKAPLAQALDWKQVHLFFGDDRCVSPESNDSNYHMTRASGLLALVPESNVHLMSTDAPDHHLAAQQYENEIRRHFKLEAGQPPRFDLILLGMGPDGHCASLFPHKPALHETERLIVASEPGLKPFVERLTSTYSVLNNAANVLFLVAGEDKAETLVRVLQGPDDFDTLPSQAVHPNNGTLTWLIDRAAAQQLK